MTIHVALPPHWLQSFAPIVNAVPQLVQYRDACGVDCCGGLVAQ
jgi:hypothetical protein